MTFPKVERVSVVIAAWNGSNYIRKTLESVMVQSRKIDEVIVVDDGSSDNTTELVRAFPDVILIEQANAGRCAARNTGIRRATGDAIIILDQDDLLLPTNVEIGVRMLNDNPEAAFSGGHSVGIDRDGKRTGQRLGSYPPCSYGTMLRGSMFVPPSVVMFRRSPLQQVGGFDTAFIRGGEDSDLYLRIGQKWPVHAHDEVVVEYRRHDSNASNDAEAMLRTSLQFMRKQKDFVATHPEYWADWSAGKAHWCRIFGRHLVMQAVWMAKHRKWLRSASIFLLALRYYPKSYVTFVRFHLGRII